MTPELKARLAEHHLRRLLACRVAGPLLYADDGEMQDNTVHPYIDFKRDSVAEIEAKLIKRTLAELGRSPEPHVILTFDHDRSVALCRKCDWDAGMSRAIATAAVDEEGHILLVYLRSPE